MTGRSRAGLVIVAVSGLALILRVIGLQYGLPAVYNPDEVAIMARALAFARGTLNPHNFLYPTFYFYVLFAWVGMYLGWVWLTGRVASLGALQQLYFTDPTGIYTAGRALGVAAGTATIGAVYYLAARLTDTRTGIAAAIFLAVAPLHVRDSHYVKHDVPATLAIVIAYLAIDPPLALRASGGPQSARHRARGSCLRRRVFHPLLLRLSGRPARTRDRHAAGGPEARRHACGSSSRRRGKPGRRSSRSRRSSWSSP